jgi:hypothetical protein
MRDGRAANDMTPRPRWAGRSRLLGRGETIRDDLTVNGPNGACIAFPESNGACGVAGVDGWIPVEGRIKFRPGVAPVMASDGDIRVLLVLDLLLSAAFTSVVLWGLDFVGLASYTLRNFALGTLALAVMTYLFFLRP